MNATDSNGESPLHSACVYKKETLELMLKYHPDMTSTDGAGRTPLEIASSCRDYASARIIREYLASSQAGDPCADVFEHT